MRVGTWNLDGNWSNAHHVFMQNQLCDVWLLTEVPDSIWVQGYSRHLSRESMLIGKRWAGVFALLPLRLVPLEDPHPTSAAVLIGNTTFVSSVLPWRTCGSAWPWLGTNTAEKTHSTLEVLLKSLPRQDLVWGGDWNHSFEGTETAGSKDGRAMIVDALKKLDLWAPTAQSPHRLKGGKSIDHVAVSLQHPNSNARHLPAFRNDGVKLSDHDAYVVDIGPRAATFEPTRAR